MDFSNEVTFRQAEDIDLPGMVSLCESQGWDTEDHKRLASILPPAVQVAKAGEQIVGSSVCVTVFKVCFNW